MAVYCLYAGRPLEIVIKDKVLLHIDFQSMTISAILKQSFGELLVKFLEVISKKKLFNKCQVPLEMLMLI